MQMISKYLVFYFEGRDEELDQDELDVEQLAKDACDSEDSPHSIALRAAEKLAAPLVAGRERKEWIADYTADIAAVRDADPNVAYAHFLQGRIEQTAAEVEDEMLELMDPREAEDDVIEKTGDDDDDDDDDDDGYDDDDDDDDV